MLKQHHEARLSFGVTRMRGCNRSAGSGPTACSARLSVRLGAVSRVYRPVAAGDGMLSIMSCRRSTAVSTKIKASGQG